MLRIVVLGLSCILGFNLITEGYAAGHIGLYSDHIPTGNLIIPRKVNHRGEHISHNVTHHHSSGEEDEDEMLHYHIEVDNETLHIELEPSSHLIIAPSMVVERHRRDLRSRKKPHHRHKCHYQGRIRGHANSKVALSACNGIAGLLKTKRGDYWVEPSKHHPATDDGHPHIVFQKSIGDKKKIESKLRRKKKKKKRRQDSNCGTKEPRRMTETRIEWQPQGKVIVQGGRKTRRHHNMQNKNKNKKRTKRSISSPRHVEALLVADYSMVSFHEDAYVETYLLTIMNMVSSLYKDPNIGNLIHVVVVKMIILQDEESENDLNITSTAELTLDNFCRWQRTLNPKDEEDPTHHDVAILVTRRNICSKTGCMTLGVANVGGMCRPDKSCSVNEDNGITLAHTVTHELGHNFGMYHDTDKIGCEARAGPVMHVMTPSFEADTLQVSWSNCSRRDITHFLDQGLGRCLDDTPNVEDDEYSYPDLPPGAMYNSNLQCRLQFNTTDETVRLCSKMDEICSQLWCLVDKVCLTLMRPAAPGTKCGKHEWCQNQKCVPIEEMPEPVDGGWGNWSDYNNCSRHCGGGVSMQTRQCDHPAPAHGGTFCIGERTRYKICNIDPCPPDFPTFRAQQCSEHNNETFRGQLYKWFPYFDRHEPCELYCTDSEDTVIVPWGDTAADGTPCNLGTNDMCISGICRKVGCDWAVDSKTTEDQCGICGGNGDNCTTIKGEFNKKLNVSDGYYEFTIIPSGSRHILIEESSPSKSFIAISKSGTDKFYLNGKRLIFMSGEYDIAGSIALYERENEKEVIKIPGPIKDDISIHILFRQKQKTHGVKYEYTLSTNSTAVPFYYWKLGDWTACTTTCGSGVQQKVPVCYQENRGLVDEENCWSNANGTRPDEKMRVCNEESCPADWWVGPWQPCPVTCKRLDDTEPVKRRSIMCVDQNDLALPDLRCEAKEKPDDTEPCGTVLPKCNGSEEDSAENNTID